MHMHSPQDDALYLAACYGHEDIVELLLAAKADPNVKHQVKLTLLQAVLIVI